MMPLSGHLGASRRCDNDLRDRRMVWIDTTIADDVVGGHVRDGLQVLISLYYYTVQAGNRHLLRRSRGHGCLPCGPG